MSSRSLDDVSPHGYRIEVDPVALEGIDIRMLASCVKFKTNYFIIPREQPMELLDLRVIFSQLRKRANCPPADSEAEETLPFEAFQRAFERMFFVLQDSEGFDAKAYDENGDGFVAWGEFFRVYKKRHITVKLSTWERIYLTFDNPESSIVAQIVSALVLLTIIISSFCFIMSTTPECQMDSGKKGCVLLEVIEMCCLLIFVIEYCMRVFTVWAVRTEVHDKSKLLDLVVGYEPIFLPSPLQRLLRFLRAPANLVDLAAILPGIFGLFVELDGGAFVVLRLIRLTRIFRAFKSPALVAPVIVIGRTVQQSTKALYVLAFNLCLGIVIFGSLMYMAEGGEDLKAFSVGGRWNETLHVYERKVGRVWNGDAWEHVWAESPFQSIPHAFWWAIVTATTVGYGDDNPTTTLGYVVAVATMVFSMVILALPVGVMGGTFSQEWEAFEKEKREQAECREREMAFITAAIKELDPTRMSRLMLIEVWNEHPGLPCKGRPTPSFFMGEVKLELDLPSDRPVSKELKVSIEDNQDMVKRSVTGRLTLKYEWTPGQPPALASHEFKNERCTSEGSPDFQLHGALKVTVVSAEKLINLNYNGGCSNPFCTVLCYPTYVMDQGPQPCCWRTRTDYNKLSPQWNTSHRFDFAWPSPGPQSAASGPAEHLANLGASVGKKPTLQKAGSLMLRDQRSSSKWSDRSVGGQGGPATPLEDTLGLLRDFSAELRQQRADMKQVRDEVHTLSSRIDELSVAAIACAGSMACRGSIAGVAENQAGSPSTAGRVGAAGRSSPVLLPNCVPMTE